MVDAVLVIEAHAAVFEMICWYEIVSVSPTSRPRVPPVGASGELGALYGREHAVEAGMADPTERPVQVTAPRDRSALLPPLVEMAVTAKAGPGFPFGPAGRRSVRSTVSPRVIGSGPAFVTLTVHVAAAPALIVDGETDFEIDSVYRQGRKSMAIDPVAPPPALVGDAVPADPLIDARDCRGDDRRCADDPARAATATGAGHGLVDRGRSTAAAGVATAATAATVVVGVRAAVAAGPRRSPSAGRAIAGGVPRVRAAGAAGCRLAALAAIRCRAGVDARRAVRPDRHDAGTDAGGASAAAVAGRRDLVRAAAAATAAGDEHGHAAEIDGRPASATAATMVIDDRPAGAAGADGCVA